MSFRPSPATSLLATALLLACGAGRAQEPFAPPAPAMSATVAPPLQLKPGEFDWHPEASIGGPVLIVVSIEDQRAYVYRSGVRIATSTVSTGRPGFGTPTGVFQILQKQKMHHSNLYDDAEMPFMQRLTWDGVALHAGRIPGRPASHGCVRLPAEFAQKLFGVTYHGGTVVITDAASPGTLDLASLPADMAKLVFARDGGWRAAALPGSVAVDTLQASGGVARLGRSD
jgi:lipoprotein-anchoring transpeptidase ErfK/SrfK